MSPLKIALTYMEIFFSGKNMERLYDILADDLIFEGPFYQFHSAQEYIDSLVSAPPIDCEYKLLKSFANGNSVNLLYTFSKPGISTPMSQWFEICDGKISKILLIFDTGKFMNS